MQTLARPVSYGPSSAADPAAGRSFGGAFWVSALLHVSVAALIILLTIALRDRPKEKPKVFELVAGAGSNFMADAAPEGSEAGQAPTGEITFTAPAVPVWTPPPPPQPAPPEPPPTPVAPVTPLPVEPVKPPPPQTPPVPNFTRQINRTIQKEKAKTEREIKKQREAEARAAKERELASKRMSHEEFLRSQNPRPQTPSRTATANTGAPGPRLDPSAIKKGVTGASGPNREGAGGTALAAAEAAAMDRYFAMLIARLRESHEKPGGLSDLLNAQVEFTLAGNGVISGVRIVRSSGNADFDQSVLEAFARVKMPARPDGKTDLQRLTFRIKEA